MADKFGAGRGSDTEGLQQVTVLLTLWAGDEDLDAALLRSGIEKGYLIGEAMIEEVERA
jgi:hypothetical protein